MHDDWQQEHRATIDTVLTVLNKDKDKPFILKGGTALMVAYQLDRFSEDIDLDARWNKVGKQRFTKLMQSVCRQHGWSYRGAKNTDTVQRCFIDYGNNHHLKIELSKRVEQVAQNQIVEIHGVATYTISELCKQKCAAYLDRNRVRDLYDVTFIANKYLPELNSEAREVLSDALQIKGIEQVQYLAHSEPDQLIGSIEELTQKFKQAQQAFTTERPVDAQELKASIRKETVELSSRQLSRSETTARIHKTR